MNIQFNEQGLVPAIVQDAHSKEVLTLAYMNEQSLQKTLETKETWFYSRSRQQLWHKGETSGNVQKVVDVRYDCDADALLILVEPKGPACHTGEYSCFHHRLNDEKPVATPNRFAILNVLESLIAEREAKRPEGSYTTYLFEKGIDKIAKKLGRKRQKSLLQLKTAQKKNYDGKRQIYYIIYSFCCVNSVCRSMMCFPY